MHRLCMKCCNKLALRIFSIKINFSVRNWHISARISFPQFCYWSTVCLLTLEPLCRLGGWVVGANQLMHYWEVSGSINVQVLANISVNPMFLKSWKPKVVANDRSNWYDSEKIYIINLCIYIYKSLTKTCLLNTYYLLFIY